MLQEELTRFSTRMFPRLPSNEKMNCFIEKTVGPVRYVKLTDRIGRAHTNVLSPSHGFRIDDIGSIHVVLFFESEGVALCLYRADAMKHHIVRQIISRKYAEEPFRVAYYDNELKTVLTTAEIIALTEISTEQFDMGDFHEAWSGKTLFSMMFMRPFS